MALNRLPVVVPAITPLPPKITLLGSALRPDNTSDPDISGATAITADQLAALPRELREELLAREGDAWVRGITYAPENHWEAELLDGCDTTSVDLPPLPAPRKTTLAEVAGGTLKAEEQAYQVTAVNSNGETTATAAATIVLAKEGSVKVTWDKVNETAQYKVYGRKKAGTKLLATVGPFSDDQAAEWVDTGVAVEGAAGPPVSNTTGGKGTYTNLPTVTAIPYVLQAEDYCSTFGFEMRDFKGRAERLLYNAQFKAIEKEHWSGALARAKELPNNYLTKFGTAEDLTPGAGAPSILRGLEILQNALGDCGFGGAGMIHVQRQTATNLITVIESDPHFTAQDGKIMDMFGNTIVPGVGYAGTGPAKEEGGAPSAPEAGNAFMFATDMVAARCEEEATIFTQSFAEATDWGQGQEPNSIRMRARKFAVTYWDAACNFCVQVKLAT